MGGNQPAFGKSFLMKNQEPVCSGGRVAVQEIRPPWILDEMMKYETYLLFGAPGSGKGTQGVTLGTIPRFFHCACGEVFRSLDTRTKIGRAFLEYSSRGELVPDEVTVELWRARLQDSAGSHHFKHDIDNLVLDGIPRNVAQAKLMEQFIHVRKVFHLSCPDRSELVARLKKRALKDNRLDDAHDETIRKRLETYEAESKPLLDYYGTDMQVEIDATQPPAVVFSRILAEIVADRYGIENALEAAPMPA